MYARVRIAVSCGDASYSIYLLHPLVFLVMKAATIAVLGVPLWIEEPIRFASILLVVVISLFSWQFFERSFIDLGNKIAMRLSILQLPSVIAIVKLHEVQPCA